MKADYQQYKFWDPKLRELVKDIEDAFGVEFTNTSMYRIGGVGVHSELPLRGTDLRCRQDSLGYGVEDFVNSRWQYNGTSGKNCCLYHNNKKGGGKHIHLQIHPNTIKL